MFRAIAKHEHDLVADVDWETRTYGPHFGLERSQSFKDEGGMGQICAWTWPAGRIRGERA